MAINMKYCRRIVTFEIFKLEIQGIDVTCICKQYVFGVNADEGGLTHIHEVE